MKRYNHLSDEKLVEMVRAQDQELYQKLVMRYQAKLLRYADSLISNSHIATDVVQEAFIKAFINLHSFDINKKFSSWIYRIVHNEAINCLKKNKQHLSLEENDWIKETMRSHIDIETSILKKEAAKMLHACLDKLPIKYRSPLVLYYMEEKSYEEISDVLRIPIGTVGTRINRGKKILKALYKQL